MAICKIDEELYRRLYEAERRWRTMSFLTYKDGELMALIEIALRRLGKDGHKFWFETQGETGMWLTTRPVKLVVKIPAQSVAVPQDNVHWMEGQTAKQENAAMRVTAKVKMTVEMTLKVPNSSGVHGMTLIEAKEAAVKEAQREMNELFQRHCSAKIVEAIDAEITLI